MQFCQNCVEENLIASPMDQVSSPIESIISSPSDYWNNALEKHAFGTCTKV